MYIFPCNLINLFIDEGKQLVLEISPLFYTPLLILFIYLVIRSLRKSRKRYRAVRLNISLGSIGDVELRPSFEDIDIAHKIWTELVTRKAAIPIDEENDVLVEVYDSWYALFGRIRLLISELPAELVRNDKSTKQIISIATDSLNKGLRPHLTKWQARYRNWYSQQEDELSERSPQEVQKDYPAYDALISDLKDVNRNLIQYAEELHKISQGS